MDGDSLFLPIGSVVLLKGATKKVMVTGFCSIPNNNKNKIYDYSGCAYPEGFINTNEVCLFNTDQIDKILFKGYVDEEEKDFQKKLINLISKIKIDSNHNLVKDDESNGTEFSVNNGAF